MVTPSEEPGAEVYGAIAAAYHELTSDDAPGSAPAIASCAAVRTAAARLAPLLMGPVSAYLWNRGTTAFNASCIATFAIAYNRDSMKGASGAPGGTRKCADATASAFPARTASRAATSCACGTPPSVYCGAWPGAVERGDVGPVSVLHATAAINAVAGIR